MSPINFDRANIIRDRRLRRAILNGLYEMRSMGRYENIDGRTLIDLVNQTRPGGQKCESDGHAMGLLRDLEAKGLINRHIVNQRRDEELGLGNVRLNIAAAGVSLIEESIGPDPDIDDERNLED